MAAAVMTWGAETLRKDILSVLGDGPMSALWIANRLEIRREDVSRQLYTLRRRGMVEWNGAWRIVR